jgi:hypothetical protein
LKNYNKSQKNHKMKNQIVLDFKLVVLHSEHTIWNALVHIFCCNFRSILFSITVKKCTKYTILYVHLRRCTHLESNTIGFFIL